MATKPGEPRKKNNRNVFDTEMIHACMEKKVVTVCLSAPTTFSRPNDDYAVFEGIPLHVDTYAVKFEIPKFGKQWVNKHAIVSAGIAE